MERNVSFSLENDIRRVRARLTWAQIDIVSAQADDIQILIAGDDDSVAELKIEMEGNEPTGNEIFFSQPQLSYPKDAIIKGRWLQLCVMIPDSWRGNLDVHTISGTVGARNLSGDKVELDTVSGALYAQKLRFDAISLHTISGAVAGELITASAGRVRTVSGRIALRDMEIGALSIHTVSGEINAMVGSACKTLEMQSVSGGMSVYAPEDAPVLASLGSLSGRFSLGGELTQGDGGLKIRGNSVSGNLKVRGMSAL